MKTTKEVTVTQCDFCDRTDDDYIITKCIVCGKDCCASHGYQIKVDNVSADICLDCMNKMTLDELRKRLGIIKKSI